MKQSFRVGTKRVLAIVSNPKKQEQFKPRLFHVRIQKNIDIKNGTVLNLSDQPKYLIWFSHTAGRYNVFNAYAVNDKIELYRETEVEHPVTKLKQKVKSATPEFIPSVKYIVDGQVDSNYKYVREVYFLGQEINSDATINNKKIDSVIEQDGIYRVEVT